MRALVTFCILFYIIQVILSKEILLNKGFKKIHKLTPPTGPERRKDLISTKFISQKLDHDDPSSSEVYDQRYMVNTEFYDASKGNFVFVMLGGEWDIAIEWMTYGSWVVTAEKYGALMFQLEHRYYGESQPFSDFSTDNLKYLSSEQALADLADFIVAMNKEYNLPSDVKWIVFGGSYSGSLAAWARLKYPDLIQGAVSHSGPLYAKLDFFEYLQVVVNDLAGQSTECVASLREAVNQIDEFLENPVEGNITDIFHLCSDIEDDIGNFLEISNFYSIITNPLSAVAQYNSYDGLTLSDVCDILTDSALGSELDRLINLIGLDDIGNYCVDYKYDSTVNFYKDVEVSTEAIDRQWFYQTCTEFGWYDSSNDDNQVFGSKFSAESSVTLCRDVFGSKFTTDYINGRIDVTNSNYGGYNIDATNIVYVHGALDPWSPLGLLESSNPDAPVIVIKGETHCAAMYISDYDSEELIAARDEVDRLVGVWLDVSSE